MVLNPIALLLFMRHKGGPMLVLDLGGGRYFLGGGGGGAEFWVCVCFRARAFETTYRLQVLDSCLPIIASSYF